MNVNQPQTKFTTIYRYIFSSLCFFLFFLGFSVQIWAHEEPQIRVLLEDNISLVSIEGEMEIIGMMVPIIATGEQLFTANELSGPLTITPVRGFLKLNGDQYRGQLLVIPTPSGMQIINQLDLEDYLYSVLPSEIDPDWPVESLKAQAIAARCYAITKIQANPEAPFHLYDDIRSQVYYGMRKEHPRTTVAVKETRGLVATYQGQVIQAYFYASSGGQTANSEDVWGTPLAYLRSVDDYDQDSPHYSWQISCTVQDIMDGLEGEGIDVGMVLDLVPLEYDTSHRVLKLKIIGFDGEEVMAGTDFRFMLGLKSTRFTLKNRHPQPVNPQSAEDLVRAVVKQQNHKPEDFLGESPAEIEITGNGWGHGVGMSQWGARAMSKEGYDFKQIINHYYQGTELIQLYE